MPISPAIVSEVKSAPSHEGPLPPTAQLTASPTEPPAIATSDHLVDRKLLTTARQHTPSPIPRLPQAAGSRESLRTISLISSDSSDDDDMSFTVLPKGNLELIASPEGSAPQTIESCCSRSRTSSPVTKKIKTEQEFDALSALIGKAAISQTLPADTPSVASCIVSSSLHELKRKRPVHADPQWESFQVHPWAHLLNPTIAPKICPFYDADLQESRFEKVTAAGYTGLTLHREHSGRHPTKGQRALILEAVGPEAIEEFRKNNSYLRILQLRTEGKPIPYVPAKGRASPEEQCTYITGLELDGETSPVLYRVKSLFGTGAKLESVHLEVPLPDRLDLHTIHLDQHSINIKTNKRGVNIHNIYIGDLIWVYSLAASSAFVKNGLRAPLNIEQASQKRSLPVWRVSRFALIARDLKETLGFVTRIVSKQYGTFEICMEGHRALVTANKNRLRDPNQFSAIQANTFIVAPFRARQIDYMMLCCSPRECKEIYAHMADVQYFPSMPPVPSDIRLPTIAHQNLVQSKLGNFELFTTRPQEVMQFLEPLYGTSCGTIAASDRRIYSAVWTSPDLNAFPALATFEIPVSERSGWCVGHFVEGAYQSDLLRCRIVKLAVVEQTIQVTAEVLLRDTTRFRTHMLNATNHRIAVGTTLTTADDRTNPILAMLERSFISSNFQPFSTAWKAARAILAGDEDLLAINTPERSSITKNVAGSSVELNAHQVNAINWFHKNSPVLIVDSAYGAGKSLCTAVMAEDAVQTGCVVLVAEVQNSALDVICAKIAELHSPHLRPVRYLSEALACDTVRKSPYDIASLMEKLPESHRDILEANDLAAFESFAKQRRELRDFIFTGLERSIVAREHKQLLFLESRASKRIQTLTKRFLRIYNPNIYLCTIASALNLTAKGGLWRQPSREWSKILLDEASMIPEATLITLMSRFQNATYTLVGDSRQLPPYVGITTVPLAVALCSQSVLDVARRAGNAPTCKISTVYRSHPGLVSLNSELFYNNELVCGTPASSRRNLVERIQMPNPDIPLAFINTVGQSLKSATSSYSNEVEANVAHIIARMLIVRGIKPDDISVICLYRDQKYLCEAKLRGTNINVQTVDSAQGSEKSIVVVCTTRTQLGAKANYPFFTDPRRLNVALSRARDGLFILGCVPHLETAPIWGDIIRWCRARRLLTELTFFDKATQPTMQF